MFNIARVRSIVGEINDAMGAIHNELMSDNGPYGEYLLEKLRTLETDVPCLKQEFNSLKEEQTKMKEPQEDVYSVTQKMVAQIVKEQDGHIFKMIEDYVKDRQSKGELIDSKIIEEGKLRHIINLGIKQMNDMSGKDTTGKDLFPQEEYIEFLRHQLVLEQQENQKLKNQISIMEQRYEPKEVTE